MTYRSSLLPFLVLSWKWYLFGLTLLGLYLWDMRSDRQKDGVHKVNLSVTSLRACRLGIVLGFFSFFLATPSQWVVVAAGFLVGAILGLALSIIAKRQLAGGLPSVETRHAGWRQSLPAIFSVSVAMVALVILSKRLPYVQSLMLPFWSGGAAFLIALNLLIWPHTKEQMRATKAH